MSFYSNLCVIFAQNILFNLINIIMNKTDLVKAVAEKAGLTNAKAKAAVDAALDAIACAVAKNDKVALLGFGTFSLNEKPARKGINPQTKKAIEIPARKVVKFKAGKEFNEKVK